MTKKCPNCGRNVIGHKNKKFCGQRCKDHYHNITNPRGYGLRDRQDDMHEYALDTMEQGWDGHKVWTE
jgi:transposase-like protein